MKLVDLGTRFQDTIRFSLTKLKEYGYSVKDVQEEYNSSLYSEFNFWDNLIIVHLYIAEELYQIKKNTAINFINYIRYQYSLELLSPTDKYPKLYENKNCFIIEDSYGNFSQYDKSVSTLKDILNKEYVELTLIDK